MHEDPYAQLAYLSSCSENLPWQEIQIGCTWRTCAEGGRAHVFTGFYFIFYIILYFILFCLQESKTWHCTALSSR